MSEMRRDTPTSSDVPEGSVEDRHHPELHKADYEDPIITVGTVLGSVPEITITVEMYIPPKPIAPTPEHLGACPEEFRCFICQRPTRKAYFAGEIRHQRICTRCWQTTDDSIVRGLINFDLKRGKQVRMYPKAKHGSFYSTKDGKKLDQFDMIRERNKVQERLRQQVMDRLKE